MKAGELFRNAEPQMRSAFGAHTEALGRSIDDFDYPGGVALLQRMSVNRSRRDDSGD